VSVEHEPRVEVLDQREDVEVVLARPVELEHRVLGVVLVADALVAEVAADLVDRVEAADDEPLEVELEADAEVEVVVEGVVVGHEGSRVGAARARPAGPASPPRGSRGRRGSGG
jgi:hypothetical protein